MPVNTCFFQICSLIYILLLTIVYFSKERYKSYETKIYSLLVIIDIIAVIFDAASIYTIVISSYIPFGNDIVCKLYLAFLLAWIILFSMYLHVISNDDISQKKIKNISLAYSIFYIVYLILLFILPLNYYFQSGIVYSYGPAAMLSYGFSGICVVIDVLIIICNFKKINKIKLLPMILFIVLGVFAISYQMLNPGVLLITFVDTLITFLMYFTIENPDMKMIAQLNEAKEAADKANNAKTDFLSSMSHEIRTPLNAIVGFSESLLDDNIPDQARSEVKDIVTASGTLLEIVNGILDISKIEANKLEIIAKDYSFKEMFDDLVNLTKTKIGEKKLDFRYKYDESIPPVLFGDETRFKQVILNILTNSVKYTKEGYIDFEVSSFKKDDMCRIIVSVEDSGIGIKKSNIDKLFTKFERLEEKNTTIEGTGLGLAITKKLVLLMGGKIFVQSVYGKGSKFTVVIDQKISDGKVIENQNNENKKEVTFDLSSKKILLVDDNNLNIKVALRLLQTYKMNIDTCLSGFECLEKVKNNNYDLVLLDDMMPGMSGGETLKKLKEIPGYNIPTIALTANATSGMREKYMQDGFDDYLSKPIEKPELNRVINQFLKK